MTGDLIGLTGHAGAGKDSVALVLCSAGYRSVAFADALRIEVAAAWRIDPRLLTDRASKEVPQARLAVGHAEDARWLQWACVQGHNVLAPRSARWLMQHWGSYRRAQHPDYWIRHVQVWMSQQWREGCNGLVITDVRMPNEAAALRAQGGRIVRVHRPGLPALQADTAQHESEGHTALQADADIHNSGTLAELAAETWRCMSALTTGAAA